MLLFVPDVLIGQVNVIFGHLSVQKVQPAPMICGLHRVRCLLKLSTPVIIRNMPFYAVRKGRKVGIYTTW